MVSPTRPLPSQPPDAVTDAPSHTVEIVGGWRLWRSFALRAAGFPAAKILRLADPDASASIDRALACSDLEAAARRAAIDRLAAERETDDPVVRRQVNAALMRVVADRSVDIAGPVAAAARELSGLAEARDAHACARATADSAYREATRRLAGVIREIAAEPLFREAVLWQNRGAVTHGIDVLLRQEPGGTSSKIRQHERLVGAYLQRYCTKNETIGFFGPVCWGTFSTRTGVAVRPGPALVSQRETYFEYWCIDALAGHLAQHDELRPDLIPRRAPTIHLDGTTLHHPIDQRTVLPPLYAALLACCDGTRRARDIAADITARADLDVSDPDEAHELLAALAEQGLITWTVEVPTSDPHPERYLRRLLADAASPTGLRLLDELDAHRREISAAAGSAETLQPALAALDATFERITTERATRNAGKVHAGRTLVYEDCRRDLELEIGSIFLDRVGEPLSLILDSMRWFTHELVARYRLELAAIHARLSADAGTTVIDYLRFWEHCAPWFPATGSNPIVEAVRSELQGRWSRILDFDPTERRVQRSVDQLRSAVAAAFHAPGPGFLGARHHTPDIMIAATSSDAFARGEFLAVLGEVVPGFNLLAGSLFVERHDRPEDILAWMECDREEVGAAPVVGKQVYARAAPVALTPRDIDVELGATRSRRERSHVLGVGSLVVDRRDGNLVVRDRARAHCFELLTFLESYLVAAYEQAGGNPLLPACDHRPRIAIDGLVVCREQWRLEPMALALTSTRGFEQFMAARRWARDLGLPRWVFVSLPEERKPVFVDFMSPISVETLARFAAKASHLTVTEMLPSLEQLWLPDASGELYTSELRIAAVDPIAWHSPWHVAEGS
jgi:hypothetical protein